MKGIVYFEYFFSPRWIYFHFVGRHLIHTKKQTRDLAGKEREYSEIYQSRLKVYHKTDGLTTAWR